MKYLLNLIGGLLSLLALIVVAVGLILLLRNASPASLGQSPLVTPTSMAQSPLPTPTPRPTSTRPPEPPTRTPRPTFTPAPPTATSMPLPTLIPGLQTFVYATRGEQGPELYRFQVDETYKVASLYTIDTRAWPASRTYIEGLYPSPDGKRIAVAWVYGEGGTFVAMLNVNNGSLAPLFGETADVDKRVYFLDWFPDGNSILVLGGIDNPDLGGNAWQVNVNTHQFNRIDIKQERDIRQITSASISPDGKTIVYAKADCFQCGSEVWRISLDGSDRLLLFADPKLRVEDVMWSPDGRHVAFTQWQELVDGPTFAVGELQAIEVEKDERRLIGSVLTGYLWGAPTWSPDSKQIAFVMNDGAKFGKELNELHSNIYVADIATGNIKQLTQFSRTQVLSPIWAPDGSALAFAANPDGTPERLGLWVIAADGGAIQQITEGHGLAINTTTANVAIVWLP